MFTPQPVTDGVLADEAEKTRDLADEAEKMKDKGRQENEKRREDLKSDVCKIHLIIRKREKAHHTAQGNLPLPRIRGGYQDPEHVAVAQRNHQQYILLQQQYLILQHQQQLQHQRHGRST